MTIEEIKGLIIKKYPGVYDNEEKISVVIGGIEKMAPAIRKSFELFLQTDKIVQVWLLGYDLDKLTKEHGLNEVAAYLTMDWIVKDPDKALSSLEKGHDFVRVG